MLQIQLNQARTVRLKKICYLSVLRLQQRRMVSGFPQILSEHAMASLQLWSLIR